MGERRKAASPVLTEIRSDRTWPAAGRRRPSAVAMAIVGCRCLAGMTQEELVDKVMAEFPARPWM